MFLYFQLQEPQLSQIHFSKMSDTDFDFLEFKNSTAFLNSSYSIPVLYPIYAIIFLLIFPFYNHVYEESREKEQGSLVFLIINHFHFMIKKLHRCYLIAIILTVASSFFYFLNGNIFWISGFLLTVVVSIMTLIMALTSRVNHLLLS